MNAAAGPFLELRAVTTGYGDVPVVKNASMSFMKGDITAIIGSNGAGKSTAMKAAGGLLPVWKGAVFIDGSDVTTEAPHKRLARGVAYVPQGRIVLPEMTVRENLDLGAYRRGRAARARNFERVCTIFPRLGERLAQRAGTLSGGEQQMLAIGRGLMAEPKLLILDEPSLGLSPLLVEELFALIGQLNREGLAILLVEQNVGQSLEIAHRACVMEQGAIRFHGTPAELLANPDLKRSYLGL